MQKYLFIFFTLLVTQCLKAQTFTGNGGSIPDAGPQTCFPIAVSGIGDIDVNLGLASVCLSINHGFTSDLEIILKSPDGTSVQLSIGNGGTGSNYTGTCFTANASMPITSATAPFSGVFLPQGYLGNVNNGQNADGDWNLCIQDKNVKDAGSLISWSLTFNNNPAPPPPGCKGNALAGNTCASATPVCNFNGFCGNTSSAYTVDTWPELTNAFCGVIENNSFLSFVASTSTVSFNIWVTNSLNGDGIEMMIFGGGCGSGPVTKHACNNSIIPSITGPSLLNATGLIPGNTYYLMIDGKNADVCDYTLVAASGIGILSIAQSKPTICQGQSMILTASGGNGIYTWFPSNGLSDTTKATVTASPDTTTVYSVISIPLGNCPLTTEITIKVNAKPDLGDDQIIRICPTGTVNLSTKFNTAALTTKWTLAGVPISNPSSVNTSGVYQLIAFNKSGCSDTALLTVTINLKPNLGNDKQLNVCQGSSADITSQFETTGLISNWTLGGMAVASPVDVYTAGNYQLIVSDGTVGSTCADTAFLSLVQLVRPNLGPDKSGKICQGDGLFLSTQFSTTGLNSIWYFDGKKYLSDYASNGGPGAPYTLVVTDAFGCSDTCILIIDVNKTPVIGSDKNFSICLGASVDLTSVYKTTGLTASWTLGGVAVSDPSNITTSGIYQLKATNVDGCSTQLTVTINADTKLNLGPDKNINLCPGTIIDLTGQYSTIGLINSWTLNDVVVANPTNIKADGDYRLIADNGASCIDTAFVKIFNYPKPSLGVDKTIAICNNTTLDLYTVFDTTNLQLKWTKDGIIVTMPTAVSISGIYRLIGTSIYGCSDTAFITLNVNPNLVLGNDTALNFCPGESIDLTNLYNTYVLNIWSLGGSNLLNPTAINLPGIYQLIASYATGCSDTALVNVTVNIKPALGGDKAITICPGSSLGLNAQYNTTGLTNEWSIGGLPVSNPSSINASGIYQLIATNSTGCADTASISVIIKPKPDLGSDKKISVCIVDNINISTEFNTIGLVDEWTFNGLVIPTPSSINVDGVYQLISTNNSGCSDTALVSVILSPKPALVSDKLIDICSNSSLNLFTQFDTTGLLSNWTFNGVLVPMPESITTIGQYRLVVKNSFGCLDTAFIKLSLKAVTSSLTKVTICSNQLPFKWNTKEYLASGVYNIILLNVAGCDSLATLDLTINLVTTSKTIQSVCSNQLPYTWNGNDYFITGIYDVILTNSTGCDSIATLALTVNPITNSTSNITVCSNQLPYKWNGKSYSMAGTFNELFANAAGCDSIATLQLFVNDTSASKNKVTICSNQLPYQWNGNQYIVAGFYDVTLTNAFGCDSIVTLDLTINLVTNSATNIIVCSNQLPYKWNGNNYSSTGSYFVTLTNATGCDSIAALILNVKDTSKSTTSISVCNNQLPFKWNGNNYSKEGSYSVVLQNAAGCDSIATLVLTVKSISTSSTSINACSNQIPFTWNGNMYINPGTYQVVLVNAAGCDSIAELILTVTQTSASNTIIKICPGDLPYSWNSNSYTTAGVYTVILKNAAGCDSVAKLQLIVNSNSTSATLKSLCDIDLPYLWNGVACNIAGTYAVVFNNAVGCDSIAYLTLNVYTVPKNPFLGNDTAICPGDKIIISPGMYDYYLWNNNSLNSSLTVTRPGIYSVKVGENNACTSTASISITTLDNCDDIYFPNAFAPNGANKMFGPAGNTFLVKDYLLQIYNRYGKIVFITNNPYQKWDGNYQGKQSVTGTYIWRASYVYRTLNKKDRNGYVVLLR